MINIRNERGDITNERMVIKKIRKKNYEQLYAKKFDILGEIDNFMKDKISQSQTEEIGNLNKFIYIKTVNL